MGAPEEAALLDGAKQWQVIWSIHLPPAKTGLAALAILSCNGHRNEF